MKRTKNSKVKKRPAAGKKRKPTVHEAIPKRESQEIVLAIRRGMIDALVTSGTKGEQILTLQGSEEPYRVLVETISDGVATVDETGVILFANGRLAAILRASTGNLIGSRLQEHVSADERGLLDQLISHALLNSTQGEITIDAAENRNRVVRLALNPVADSDPRTVCVVATELTELAEANKALKAREDALAQLSGRLLKLQDEERRRIARDLHDITGQKLAVQAMTLSEAVQRNEAKLDDESKRLLSECSKLNRQVGDEIRVLSYLLHPPLLDELGLTSAIRWYAEGFEKRTGIALDVAIAEDFPRLSPDAEVALFRVVQESLTNIHRYSGSANARIELPSIADHFIQVQVTDFGRGIPSEILNARSEITVPLGVGIQGMKERMRQLGGHLHIASQLGSGTTVTAMLPIPVAQPADVEPGGVTVTNETTQAEKDLSPDAARTRILIADDHEMLRRGLRAMLEKEAGWEVCGEAVNGKDAVDKVSALRPDLLILDINMPLLNGLAATRQILRKEPNTKILVFTVHDSAQTAKDVQAAGAHGYLSKSKASDDLVRVVKMLLEGKTSNLPNAKAVLSAV